VHSSFFSQIPRAKQSAPSRLQSARLRDPQPRLVAAAVEPSGEGPYVDAVRELIEQIAPSSSLPRRSGALRLVR
jgi:hypothetical protein